MNKLFESQTANLHSDYQQKQQTLETKMKSEYETLKQQLEKKIKDLED